MGKEGRAIIAPVILVAAVLALPIRSIAEDLTTVVGEVRLRQALADVQKQFPEMKELRGKGQERAIVEGAFIRRFAVRGVKPYGLPKATDMELRFWKDQLWLAIFQFGDNREADVRAALEKRFGAKPAAAPQAFWDAPNYSVALQVKPRWFSIQDPVLTAEAQRWFLEMMGRKVNAPPPTPAAVNPAPAAPEN
jgi:hypothetical protein